MTPDWTQIKKEYLAGMTLKDISEKHNVPYGTLKNHSSRSGWTTKKQDISDRLVTELVKSEAEEIQAMKNSEREDILNLSKVIQDKISNSLNAQEIQQLTASYEKIQKMLYKSYGINDKFELDHTTKGKELPVTINITPVKAK